MSVSVQQILGFLRAVAPQELALDWDNVGLLVDAGQPVDGVLTTLDITPAVVREAVENDCQLIVSHHPVIFHPLRTLAADDVPALLMKNGISAICMHTNLDAAPGGVNDTLCDILGIAAEGRESFAEGCGRIGTTMPTTVEALAKFCAATLHSGVKYVNGQKPVTCLAEVSGGGGSYLEEAIARGADCLVTGEAAHHIALLARQKGIGLVVAGHWGTEHAIADVLAVPIPELRPMFGFEQHNPHHDRDVWQHTVAVVEHIPPEPVLRWAALLHDVGKPPCFSRGPDGVGHFYGHAAKSAELADAILMRLRFDTAGRTRITQLIRYHDLPIAPEAKPIRRLINKLGVETVRQLFELHIADTCGQSAICAGRVEVYRQAERVLDELLAADACFSLKDLAVNGDDLLTLGLRGRAVGAALQACLDAVMDETLPNDRAALLAYAAENLQRFANS